MKKKKLKDKSNKPKLIDLDNLAIYTYRGVVVLFCCRELGEYIQARRHWPTSPVDLVPCRVCETLSISIFYILSLSHSPTFTHSLYTLYSLSLTHIYIHVHTISLSLSIYLCSRNRRTSLTRYICCRRQYITAHAHIMIMCCIEAFLSFYILY